MPEGAEEAAQAQEEHNPGSKFHCALYSAASALAFGACAWFSSLAASPSGGAPNAQSEGEGAKSTMR